MYAILFAPPVPPGSGLTVESVMRFATHALRHAAGSVRECAERLIESLYRDVGAPVRDHLPADDAAARRSALYRQLFEAFDRVDGKPSKDDVKVRLAAPTIARTPSAVFSDVIALLFFFFIIVFFFFIIHNSFK